MPVHTDSRPAII